MSSETASVVKKLRSIVHLCQSSDMPHSRAYPLGGSSEVGGIIWSREWKTWPVTSFGPLSPKRG
jgi:hypothetical protein